MTSPSNITIRRLTVFQIDLPGNAGTGYSWELTLRSAQVTPGLQLVDRQTKVLNNLPGGGNVTTYTIKAVKKGHQQVNAIYRRPWEPITGNETNYHLNVNVI